MWWSTLGLVIAALVLLWASLAVAAVAVCENETPGLAERLGHDVPTAGAVARAVLWLFGPLGAQDVASPEACVPAAPARAMALTGLAYLAGLFILDRGRLSGRVRWVVVCVVGAVIQLALVCMPALLSSDIIDYASHGRVASLYGANPYVLSPTSFPSDPFSGLGAWPMVVTVYGPLWTRLDAALTGLLPDGDLVQLAFAYKLVALAAELGTAAVIVWIVRRWNKLGMTERLPVVALAMWLWNPLVNIELVGNAHNEALMILFLVLAFAFLTVAVQRGWRSSLWIVALVSVWFGALVKFVPTAVEAIIALTWLRQIPTFGERVRRFGLLVAILVGIGVAVAWPWLDSPAVAGPLLGVAEGGQRFKDAWQDAPAAWLAVRVVPRLGVPDTPATLRMDVARTMVWAVTRIIFAVYVLIEAWFAWRQSTAAGLSVLGRIASAAQRVLLLSVLLYVSQVYPWYFLWPLPLACLLGWRSPTSQAVIVFGVTFLPAYYLREFQSYGVFYLPVYGVVGLAILALIWFSEHRPRLRLAIRY
jgi:alpha-1,6-mannosyltransferase